MAEKREEEDAEEEEELIFPLWEKHMLDLKSWRESSHLALIGIKRVGGETGRAERMRGKEMPWLLLMIYCVKCERCFGGCLSFRTFSRSSLQYRLSCMSVSFTLASINVIIRQVRRKQFGHLFHCI